MSILECCRSDQLCGAGRSGAPQSRLVRTPGAGSYERTLADFSAGEAKSFKVPKLRRQTSATAIIGRYRRRESSVEATALHRDVIWRAFRSRRRCAR